MQERDRAKIEKAINNNDTNFLKKVNIKSLKNYSYYPEDKNHNDDNGLNALMHACIKANFATIKLIVKRMHEYFEGYMNPKTKYDAKEKEAIEELRDDDYTDFFYSTFSDGIIEYNAATIVLMRGDNKTLGFLKKKVGLQPVDDDLIEIKKKREELAKQITQPLGGTFKGYYSSGEIKERVPRSFATERERQLLKQLSTILFFQMRRTCGTNMIEIQAMHLRIKDVSYLFIAGNKATSTAKFAQIFTSAKILKKILIKNQKITGDIEGRARVERYTANFRKGIFSKTLFYRGNCEDSEDLQEYKRLKALMNENSGIKFLKLKYSPEGKLKQEVKKDIKSILNGNEKIIFVNTSSCKKSYALRHAEEFLVDIADVVAEEYEEFYTCIGGKKRPCITCYGRMKDSNLIDNFGERPGLLWLQALNLQDKFAARESIHTLIKGYSYVTLNRDKDKKLTDYDSGTDTDSEDEIEATTLRLKN